MRFFAVLAACLCVAHQTSADDPPGVDRDVPSRIAVELEISPEFDVAHPGGQLTCYFVNRSEEVVRVPTGYDGRRIRIFGIGLRDGKRLHRWPLTLYRRSSAQAISETVVVKAGQKAKLFELSLAEIFADTRPHAAAIEGDSPRITPSASAAKAVAPKRVPEQWGWDWPGRPMPPPSPILMLDGYANEAELWIELRNEGTEILSERVKLKVKAANEGDARVSVPDVTGLSRVEADKKLRAAGLTPYVLVGSLAATKAQVDTVIEQQPPAGTQLRPNTWVTVYLYGEQDEQE